MRPPRRRSQLDLWHRGQRRGWRNGAVLRQGGDADGKADVFVPTPNGNSHGKRTVMRDTQQQATVRANKL